jgi:hypothetical protein
MASRWIVGLLVMDALALGALSLPSCGARSELLVGEPAPDPPDAAPDAPAEADAPFDAPPDVPEPPPDGLPTCVPDALYVYLVTSEYDLFRYRPDTSELIQVGTLACDEFASPFSMGVDRLGTAYVVYNDGQLYRVSTSDASCKPTGWSPGEQGFNVFGMGFAIDDDGMGESLHVAEISFQNPSKGLGRIDTQSFELDYIGEFSDNPGFALELTSSDDGKLYGYFLDPNGLGGYLVDIDKQTAALNTVTPLPIGSGNSSLAFAYWGGDFYVFTGDGAQQTKVTRYRPSDGSTEVVGNIPRTVVGAGVSTCSL